MNKFFEGMKSDYNEFPEEVEGDSIHPSACVHPGAELADDVVVGPFSYVGKHVKIDSGTVLKNHVNLTGNTTVGKNNILFPQASIGSVPQDHSYRGETCRLEIGDGNVFREAVTVNLGTEKDIGVTRIGSNNFIMAYAHIAHDCILEDDITIANGVQLGGHVTIESSVVFGGLTAVHHFVTIGRHAFVGGMSRLMRDVPPFMTTAGDPARIRSLNSEGLKRYDFPPETINSLKEAHRTIFRSEGNKKEAIDSLRSRDGNPPEVDELIEFMDNMRASSQGRAREADRDF